MKKEKTCKFCGSTFYKRPRDSFKQWSAREYCTKVCANRANGLKVFKPINERFFSKFTVEEKSGCWIWMGVKDQNGYGSLHLDQAKGKRIKAHRYSYKYRYGDFDEKLFVCHRCDNPSCVNPEHLFIGTQKDNMRDCSNKGRLNPKSLLNLCPGAAGVRGAAKNQTRK